MKKVSPSACFFRTEILCFCCFLREGKAFQIPEAFGSKTTPVAGMSCTRSDTRGDHVGLISSSITQIHTRLADRFLDHFLHNILRIQLLCSQLWPTERRCSRREFHSAWIQLVTWLNFAALSCV